MKKAVFPGSFDPLTYGHIDIICRGSLLFDEIIVAIGINAQKNYLYPLEKRLSFIEQAFKDNPAIKVDFYEGLTVDFCKRTGAQYIIRGLRTGADFEYEKTIADANKCLTGIETISLFSAPEHSFISSTIVRDIIKHEGDLSKFIPDYIEKP